jgi:hypothetical protein
MEEEGALPIEEEEEPTSEFVDGLELIFGRGKSGYKDVYPHRKGWQAKVAVEDKGVCSLGIFKDKRRAAIAVARAKARGLYLLHSPDKTRAKPGFGGAREPGASFAKSFHDCFLSRAATRLMKMHSEAKAAFASSCGLTNLFFGINRERLGADCTSTGAAAGVGRMHESMHGRHAGSARAACGCARADPTDPAVAVRPPPRWRPPPGPQTSRS